MTKPASRARMLAAALAMTLALGGCGLPTLRSLPAPNNVSGPTYTISAGFEDALNLPIGAKVKVNGAIIGEVTKIETKNFMALVTMRIRKDQPLPLETHAQIRFTTPLGELYVAMYPPAGHSDGNIAAGGRMSATQTTAAPTIEDAFAALSALINGGGLEQIGTIVTELNKTLSNNATPVRDLLKRLDSLIRNFNQHKNDFNRALDGMNRLTATFAGGNNVIDQALTTFPPAIHVLTAETDKLDSLLTHVTALGNVVTSALHRGTAAVLEDIDSARPVLTSLAGVRNELGPVLQGLVDFGKVLKTSAPGDYLTAYATVTLDFTGDAVLPPTQSGSSSSSSTPHAVGAREVVATVLGGGTR